MAELLFRAREPVLGALGYEKTSKTRWAGGNTFKFQDGRSVIIISWGGRSVHFLLLQAPLLVLTLQSKFTQIQKHKRTCYLRPICALKPTPYRFGHSRLCPRVHRANYIFPLPRICLPSTLVLKWWDPKTICLRMA